MKLSAANCMRSDWWNGIWWRLFKQGSPFRKMAGIHRVPSWDKVEWHDCCSLHAVTSSLIYYSTHTCNLFVLYNKNSNGLLKDFFLGGGGRGGGMKKEKQVCWRDLTWIWRHSCVCPSELYIYLEWDLQVTEWSQIWRPMEALTYVVSVFLRGLSYLRV